MAKAVPAAAVNQQLDDEKWVTNAGVMNDPRLPWSAFDTYWSGIYVSLFSRRRNDWGSLRNARVRLT